MARWSQQTRIGKSYRNCNNSSRGNKKTLKINCITTFRWALSLIDLMWKYEYKTLSTPTISPCWKLSISLPERQKKCITKLYPRSIASLLSFVFFFFVPFTHSCNYFVIICLGDEESLSIVWKLSLCWGVKVKKLLMSEIIEQYQVNFAFL